MFFIYVTNLDHKRPSSIKFNKPDFGGISGGQGGYATNFGSGLSGSAESQIIAIIFKNLVSKFVELSKEIKNQENVALYKDIRQFIRYVQESHGGPFRRVALSGILGVTIRPHKKPPLMQTTRVIRHIQYVEPKIQNYTTSEDIRNQRRLNFKSRSASSTCAVSVLY